MPASGADTHVTHTHPDLNNSNRPTNTEIALEVTERGYKMDHQSMMDFIEYNNQLGWKMDWKKALKKWADHEQVPKPKKNPTGQFGDFPQRTDQKHKDDVAKVIAMNAGG